MNASHIELVPKRERYKTYALQNERDIKCMRKTTNAFKNVRVTKLTCYKKYV